MDLGVVHILRPWWLLAMPCGAALIAWAWSRERPSRAWRRVCDPMLLAHLGIAGGASRSAGAIVLACTVLVLASLALAGPSWRDREQPVFRSVQALVVLLDLSRSMDASDLEPSRLARARFKVADLLERARDGQSGLVVYAGDAFVVAPLTDDIATLVNFLPALTTDLMPVQGSRADLALERAGALLAGAGVSGADLILISDGVDGPRASAAAATLAAAGHRVSALAVGSERGAPVPLAGGGFLTDRDGNIVVPGLDAAGLAAVARAGGGVLTGLTADDADLQVLRPESARGATATDEAPRSATLREDGGSWLVVALLPLVALAFRRGWLLAATAALLPALALSLSLAPLPARAFELDSLWLRADQRAARALAAGAPRAAIRLAPGPRWRGAARYRDGDFDGATDEYARLAGPDARYNEGNALARSGRLREALEAYDAALAADPGMSDALHNRALVDALLRAQPPESAGAMPGAPGEVEPSAAQARGRGAGAQAAGQSPTGLPAPPGGGPTEAGDERPTQAPGTADPRQPGEPGNAPGRRSPPVTAQGAPGDAEAKQALENWMRRIPDDPGGLLRRQFALEHRRRGEQVPEQGAW